MARPVSVVYLAVRSSFVQTDPAFTRQKEMALLPKCQRTGDLSQSAFAATGQQANISNAIVAITPFARRVPIPLVPHFEKHPVAVDIIPHAVLRKLPRRFFNRARQIEVTMQRFGVSGEILRILVGPA